jgi:hypothetical protein
MKEIASQKPLAMTIKQGRLDGEGIASPPSAVRNDNKNAMTTNSE